MCQRKSICVLNFYLIEGNLSAEQAHDKCYIINKSRVNTMLGHQKEARSKSSQIIVAKSLCPVW